MQKVMYLMLVFVFIGILTIVGCDNNPQSSSIIPVNAGDEVVGNFNSGSEILLPLSNLGFILNDDPINKRIDIFKNGKFLYRVIYISDGMQYIKPNIVGADVNGVIIVGAQDRASDDYNGGARYEWFIYNNILNPLQKTSIFTYSFMFETEVIHVNKVRTINNSLIFKGSGYYEETYSVYQGNGLFKNYWRSWNQVKNIWEWHQ